MRERLFGFASSTAQTESFTRLNCTYYELAITSLASLFTHKMCYENELSQYHYRYDRYYSAVDCASSEGIRHNETAHLSASDPPDHTYRLDSRSVIIIFFITLFWFVAVGYACVARKHQRQLAVADAPSQEAQIEDNPEERAKTVKNALFVRTYLVANMRPDLRNNTVDKDIESQIGNINEHEIATACANVDDAADVEICNICLCQYDSGDEIASSKYRHCNHIYHVDCITLWLVKHEDCPMCRNNMLSLPEDVKTNEADQA